MKKKKSPLRIISLALPIHPSLRRRVDGSKNIYGDDGVKQLFVFFSGSFFYEAQQRSERQACSLFGDLMEFSRKFLASYLVRE